MARLLLENGANVEAELQDGGTALHIAAWSGHEAIARLLLQMGACIEAEDECGMTALLYAARRGHERRGTTAAGGGSQYRGGR